MLSICSIEGCNNICSSLGWCKLHYQHYRRNGDPLVTKHEMHGLNNLCEYPVWSTMKARCNNPNNQSYDRYGKRGIKVCKSWQKSFLSFYKDMGPRPSDKHSIDRIDNNGDYEPGNCRWATKYEQLNNYSRNRFFTINGRQQTMRQWADEINISYSKVQKRLARGWSIKRALEIEEKVPC